MKRQAPLPALALGLALALPLAAQPPAPGTKAPVFTAEDEKGEAPAIAAQADGGSFVVANSRPPGGERQPVTFRLLGPDGKPVRPGETPAHAPDRPLRTSYLSTWSGPSGHFVITWTQGESHPPAPRMALSSS